MVLFAVTGEKFRQCIQRFYQNGEFLFIQFLQDCLGHLPMIILMMPVSPYPFFSQSDEDDPAVFLAPMALRVFLIDQTVDRCCKRPYRNI